MKTFCLAVGLLVLCSRWDLAAADVTSVDVRTGLDGTRLAGELVQNRAVWLGSIDSRGQAELGLGYAFPNNRMSLTIATAQMPRGLVPNRLYLTRSFPGRVINTVPTRSVAGSDWNGWLIIGKSSPSFRRTTKRISIDPGG